MTPELFIATTLISAGGTILGGISAKQEAELTAFNIETQKRENKVLAMQQARARREEYDLATASNVAAFAAAGRDVGTDRSVQAFLERQKEIIAQDLGRIDQQAQFEGSRMDLAAMTERRRGRNVLYASLFPARS